MINDVKQTAYQPEDVLRQRGPMLFIDQINQWTNDTAQCSVIVGKNRSFVDTHERVPAWVGLEYMCQAIAALEGIRRRHHGRDALISFVLGSRHIKAQTSFFSVGERLLIEIKSEMRSEMKSEIGLGVYSCSIKCGPNTLMQAHIKGMMPEDPYSIIYRG